MKEQLITFQTAKLAKEKGFDEVWCDYTYCIDYNTVPEDKEIIKCDRRDNVKGQFHLALAPTQSLMQKWLRDKHRIHIESSPYNTEDFKLYYGVGLIFLDTLTKENWDVDELVNHQIPDMFDSYEDALESGIVEALKLI
jgi:hypothetical protein